MLSCLGQVAIDCLLLQDGEVFLTFLKSSIGKVSGIKELRCKVYRFCYGERFAGINVDAKKQPRLLPGVKVSAGGFPVNPARPPVLVGAMSDGLGQNYHIELGSELFEVRGDITIGYGLGRISFNH